VDDIVVFRPLGQEELKRIVDIQLDRVSGLTDELGVELEVTPEARAWLAREGYDPVFGARPIKRAIQRSVQNPLAMYLLDEEVPEGTRIVVAPGEGRLTFRAVEPGRAGEVGDEAPGGEGVEGDADGSETVTVGS
jgi:ATP-dependent Clp protease ATP-binding subunit ClpA